MFDYNWVIFETLAGSHLYGTNTPDSDIDKRGVCIPPDSILLSPFSNFEQHEVPQEDTVYYGLRKFFQLSEDCNPNIIELFFSSNSSITKITGPGKKLIENSHLFLSQKIRFTFTGYAISQLNRIQRHYKWITHPISPKQRSDFGLPEMPLYSFEKLNSLLASPREIIKEEYAEYAIKEMNYRQYKSEYDEYSTWMKNRNPKRFDLEQKYGYDTKHGMHLFRLLLQAEELLTTEKLVFPLKEKGYLLSIRNGLYDYGQLIEIAGNLKEKIDAIPSNLPKKPNIKKIEQLYFEIKDLYNE